MSSQEEEEELMKISPSSSIRPENVNKDVLPLVFPAIIPKSSKDPNRGLYPRRRPCGFGKVSDIAAPVGHTVSFTKASYLYKSRLNNKNYPMEDRLNKPLAATQYIPSLINRLNKHFDDNCLNYDVSNRSLVPPSTSSDAFANDSSSSSNIQISSLASCNNPNDNEPKKKRIKTKHVEKVEQSKNTLLKYYTKTDSTRNVSDRVNNDSTSENNPEEKFEQKKFIETGSRCNVKEIEEINRNSINQCGVNGLVVESKMEVIISNRSALFNTNSESREVASFECHRETHTLSKIEPCCSKYIARTSRNLTNASLNADDSPMNKNGKLQNSNLVDSQSSDETYHFGLFGASDKCNEEIIGENYFEYLPIDLIELILRQIPFLDLMKLCCVCKSWNEIISNPKFVEWRKTYYYVKSGCQQSEFWQSVELYFTTNATSIENCFSNLISFMCTEYVRKPPSNLNTFLYQFPRCVNAKQLLMERFPEELYLSENPWGILTVTVLLSEVVEDVYNILYLLKCEHPFLYESVVEAMYCVATVLLYFIRTFSINHGTHYRLFNAIYLLENKIPVNTRLCSVKPEMGLPGQQSLHSYCEPVVSRMTYEQIRILNHRLRPNQRIKVIAFAGTGKTTTLIQFARIYSNLKFLNVMFNKAVCEYASSRFPHNVVCKTAHSLAYQAVGKLYRYKLNFKLKPHDIMSLLCKPESIKMNMYSYSRCVLLTIENFTQSADEHITTAHVPKHNPKLPGRLETSAGISATDVIVTDRQRLAILDEAEKLWEKMVSRDDKECKITHDVYLKMYQLRHPNIPNYDCIMIDEAQDCNAAMLDIMLSQNVPVILVGDPNQQIYGFRGAKNSLQSITATHAYHLTRSFRFGPEIAYVASCCLEALKQNTQSTLVGNLKESYVDGTVKGQYAVIARSNEKLFIEAIRLCCTSERREFEPENFYGAFAGGIASYGLDQIIAIYKLQVGKSKSEIRDPFIKKFNTFNDLRVYAISADDKNILTKIELVLRYGSDIVNHINQVKQKCSCNLEMATIVFSTAHKAKGLEFDTVALVNDFQVGTFQRHLSLDLTEEFNILYVALTRAKKCLVICEKLHFALLEAQEKFEYPVPSSAVLDNLENLSCVVCSVTFVPYTALTLVRRDIVMASGRKIKGGPLCMKCATKPHYTPEVHYGFVTVHIDVIKDLAHSSLAGFIGPLPSDEPIVHSIPHNFYIPELRPYICIIRHPLHNVH